MPFDAANPRGPEARWFSQGGGKGTEARERAPAESAEA